MGIPMWREPSEADNLKSTLEKDPSAAARSAIRRQQSIRRPSRHGNRGRGPGLMSSFHTQILDEIQRGLGEPQVAVRSPVMNMGMSEDGLDLDSSRREALRSSTRSNPHRREHTSRRARNARDQSLPDLLGPSDAPMRSNVRISSPSITPHLATASAYHHTSHPSSDGVRLPPLPPLRRTDTRGHPAHFIPPVLLRDYRASHGSNRASRESAMDGLGDRQRSLSPDTEPATEAWDLLLSTITPDATLPSTDTSFSSTASATDASRNGTSRNSGASSQTTLPSPMPSSRDIRVGLDPYPDHLHPCDISSSDDEDTPVNYRRVLGRSSLPLAVRRSPGLPSTMSSHPPAPTISFSFSDSSDADLQQMQAILDRFARRQDIPDDWWAGAGLSRTIGRGLNTSADAPENQGP